MRMLFLILFCGGAFGYPASWATQQGVQPTNMPPIRIAGSNLTINAYRTWQWSGDQKVAIDGFTNSLNGNLVAWYDFFSTNEPGANNGTNAVDYSISNSPATVFIGTSSGATFVASSGPTSSYYSFNGTYTQRLSIAHISVTTNIPFSISLWYNFTGAFARTSYPVFMTLKYSNLNFALYFGISRTFTGIIFGSAQKFSWQTGVYPKTNEWAHVVLVNIGGDSTTSITWRVYQNMSSMNVVSSGELDVGNDSSIGSPQKSVYKYDGFVDDVRIYNIALTAQQVTNIFNATKASHPNPVW